VRAKGLDGVGRLPPPFHRSDDFPKGLRRGCEGVGNLKVGNIFTFPIGFTL
jgi:hypothetical protein